MGTRALSYRCLIVLFAMLCISLRGLAKDIYVNVNNHAVQNGTKEYPFGALEDALRYARELRRLDTDPAIAKGITIHIETGIYTPSQTILIRPEDSGTKASPTVIRGTGPDVIFSGGVPVNDWKQVKGHKGQVYVADVPKVGGKRISFRQLWVNDKKAIRAESHDDLHLPRILNWNFEKGTALIPNDFKGFAYTEGMEFFIHQWWAIAQLRIKDAVVSKDSIELYFHEPERKIQNEHPWPKPWLSTEHGNSAFKLVNAIQFLDQPGEWYLDEEEGKVYYYKRAEEDMPTAKVVAPYLETILQIEGTLEQPVSHIIIEHVSFQYTGWERPRTHGHVALQAGMYFHEAYKLQTPGTTDKAGLENQAWVGRPKAAVVAKNTSHTVFQRCQFKFLAATGFDFEEGNDGDRLEGNLFYDIGGNGVLIGKFSDTNVEAHLPYNPTDQREITRNIVVKNNVIHHVANEDWGALGIGAGFVKGVEISHNDLSELPYTGISLGWGWTPTINVMCDNIVSHNLINRYGKFMYDVAGIYTLSAQPGSRIVNNSIDSIYVSKYAHLPDHWFYLYTDEGSAYMDVSNNWFPSNKILRNANGPLVGWKDNGPEANLTKLEGVGVEKKYRDLLTYKTDRSEGYAFNSYTPFTKPVFVQLYDPTQALSTEEFVEFITSQGISTPEIYTWGNYDILMTSDEMAKKVSSAFVATYPKLELLIFNDLFYSFDRKRCDEPEQDAEIDFVLLTAQLVDDPKKQQEYFDYHQTQFEEWPQVSKGFCDAQFREVLLYRKGRQLLLYISFPKGQQFEELDKLTTADNPRVIEWNRIMSAYQEGIEGTANNETWIFYKQ